MKNRFIELNNDNVVDIQIKENEILDIFDINEFGPQLITPMALMIIALIMSVLVSTRYEKTRFLSEHSGIITIFFWIIAFVVIVLIGLAEYLQFTIPGAPVINGVQARYFVPVLLLIVIPFILLIRQQIFTRLKAHGYTGDNKDTSVALWGKRSKNYGNHIVRVVDITSSEADKQLHVPENNEDSGAELGRADQRALTKALRVETRNAWIMTAMLTLTTAISIVILFVEIY